MKHVKLFPVILLSLLAYSCAFVSFEKLTVECNAKEDIEFFEEDYIILNFSISPDHKDIENNLKLSNDGSTTECEVVWEDSTCSIKPKNGWDYGSVYDFVLSNSLLMDDGRSYRVNIRRMFYYGDSSKYLKLENCSIENDAVIEKNTPLEFTFNTAVNILSFKDDFSITPNIAFDIKFDDDNKKVIITPTENWKTNTYYVWNLEKVKSGEKYPLIKAYSQGFYAPQDTVQPEVASICPVTKIGQTYTWFSSRTLNDLQVDNYIGIVFSEPVDFDSLKNAVSFSPNIEGYLVQYDEEGTKFVYCVQDYWNATKEYEMTISKSLKDINDIALYEDYVVYFTASPAYYEIEKITVNQTDITVFDETINHVSISAGLNVVVPVYIYYSKAVTDEYKNIAYQGVSVNSYFPSTAMSPTVLSAAWTDDYTLKIEYQGFTKSTAEVTNYYLINISGGTNNILDEYGNYLEENVCAYFTVQ